jgi:Tol biopolymer transport system component
MGLRRASVKALNGISGRFAASLVILPALLLTVLTAAPAKPNGADVTIFAPGPLPTSAASSASPAFTPDGNTVYLGQSTGASNNTIVFSQRIDGQWSAPKPAAFCGQYRDLEPAFAPNGKYLIFASSRPTTPGGVAIDGHYNGQVYAGMGGNLWKVELTKKGWKSPERLPASINSNTSVFSPAVAADGSLYFMRAENGGKFHIYRAQMRHGKFETPVLASFSDAEHGEYDPAVAPDESFLIFSSGRAPAPPKTTDLFIVFRTANGWGEPIDLRSALSEDVHGIEARLSPDGKTLYFSNARSPSGADVPNGRYIWSVDLTDLLKAHGVRR